MARKYRVKRASVVTSLAVAVLVFPFAFIAVGGLLLGIGALVLPVMLNTGIQGNGSLADIIICVAGGLPLLVAGLVSWWMYVTMRWEDAEVGGRYCVQCGYDLTGNVSGRCPECGLARAGDSRAADGQPPG